MNKTQCKLTLWGLGHEITQNHSIGISRFIKNAPRLLITAPTYVKAMEMFKNKTLPPAFEGDFVKAGKNKQATTSNLKTNSIQWSK